MSPVARPAVLGTIGFSRHVWPPSLLTKMGALAPPSGSGVKADAAIWTGLLGLTARLGSLSWLVSPLSDLGTMLITWIMELLQGPLWGMGRVRARSQWALAIRARTRAWSSTGSTS